MRSYLAFVALKIGLAFVFASSGVAILVSPQDWAPQAVIWIVAAYQLILPLFLIFRKNVTWPALLATLTLLLGTFFHIGEFELIFRDIGLALASLALMFLGRVRS